MLPAHLILVRHGLSEANVLQTRDKAGDSTWYTEEHMTVPDNSWRLAPEGVEQAKTTGKFLNEEYPRSYHITAMVSPFTRTRETAGNLGLPLAWTENRTVRERSWGEIDAIPRHMFKEQYPNNYYYKKRDPLYWAPPAGESIANVAENRVQNLLDSLQDYNEFEENDDIVLLVTHGEFMWATRIILENWSDEKFVENDKNPDYKIHNAAVLEYTRINPEDCEESDEYSHVRMSYPQKNKDGTYSMVVGEWEPIQRKRYKNEELIAKAEKNDYRVKDSQPES